jgi:hypothetical protein
MDWPMVSAKEGKSRRDIPSPRISPGPGGVSENFTLGRRRLADRAMIPEKHEQK